MSAVSRIERNYWIISGRSALKGAPSFWQRLADVQIARQVADHLKLFDLVFASDGTTNLSGESKRDRLVREFGEKGFDYAGNDRHDLVVWSSARKAIVVNPTRLARSGVARVAQVDRVFEDRRKGRVDHLKPLRPQHWLKNLLVFVPSPCGPSL